MLEGLVSRKRVRVEKPRSQLKKKKMAVAGIFMFHKHVLLLLCIGAKHVEPNVILREITLTISVSTGEHVSMESEPKSLY